jgi:hypothetical protein
MFGHDNISMYHEAVLLPHLFEDSQKKIAASGSMQTGLPTVTTARDKVQVPRAIIANQSLGHPQRVA